MKKNGNNKKIGDYYAGIDSGSNSCGWAVTDENYNLLRFKGKDMWGARLFDSANDASKRRLERGNRRRLERKKTRLSLLEMIFNNEITKLDPSFFIRLHESNLYPEDKKDSTCKYSLFNDSDYTDEDYLKEYPTIYHLRQELIHSSEAHDIRLIFLAIHHILKNRGHFLYESSDSNETKTLDTAISDFQKNLDTIGISFMPQNINLFKEALQLRSGKTEKEKLLKQAYGTLDNKDENEIDISILLKFFSGAKIDLYKLFKDESLKESELGKISIEDDLESKYDELSSLLADNTEILFEAKDIFDLARLTMILGDDVYISDAKVKLYNKNHEDFRILKNYFIRKLENNEISKEQFDLIFSVKKNKTNNFQSYLGNAEKMCSQEEFCNFLKKFINDLGETEDEKRVFEDINNNVFFTKLRGKENGLVPYQLQLKELKKILSNAKHYLSFLSEKGEDEITVEEKIISLLTFRIPYYVGPLAKPSDVNRSWLERTDEVIYPWNFTNVVDLQNSAKKFMKNLIGRCTYTGETVLPKDSLLYCEYTVLNEINSLKINGNPVLVEVKQKIYEDLFLNNNKRVTKKTLKNYLIANGIMEKNDEISGVDDKINSSLKSYHDFKEILEKTNNRQQVEDIIEHILVFGSDKKMLKRWLDENTIGLDINDKKHILRLNYKEWGRLSNTFLTDIYHIDKETNEAFSIMDMLWNTNNNLMILMNSPYTFRDKAKEYRDSHFGLNSSLKERLDEMYISPAVRRSIWQAIRVMDEIVDIQKCAPKKIFIEMARTSSKEMEKKRTESRKDKLSNLYSSCKEQVKNLIEDFDDLNDKLKNESDQRLRSDKLYLYYTQMGRCMYTGEPIDLTMLLGNDNTYDIDHIFPQSKIIDDSLDNRVLVKSRENREKSNEYPIKQHIRSKMLNFWFMLHEKGMISDKKFDRLKRATPLTEEELSQFVHRQLVETQQSTKALASILSEIYPNTKIVYSKAGNISRFRQKYQIPKFRNVNDFHHAKDAYLNIVVGNVFDTKFTENFFLHILEKQNEYSLNKVFEFDTARAWIAPKHFESVKYEKEGDRSILSGSIKTVYKYIFKNTPIVTFAPYQQKGELFDLQIKSKGNGQLAIKKGLDIEKYGGYNKVHGTYYFVAEYTDKKNRIRSILPVYLYAVQEYEKNPIEYCEQVLGLKNPRIIVNKILNSALFEINGSRVMITGRTGSNLVCKHGYQLAIDDEHSTYLKSLEKYVSRCIIAKRELEVTKFDFISKEKNLEMYEWFLKKFQKNVYKKLFGSLESNLTKCKDKFIQLDILNQSKILIEILKAFQCDRQCPSLEVLNGTKTSGIIKVNSKISNYNSIYLINQSVTGLYEVKVNLLKE